MANVGFKVIRNDQNVRKAYTLEKLGEVPIDLVAVIIMDYASVWLLEAWAKYYHFYFK